VGALHRRRSAWLLVSQKLSPEACVLPSEMPEHSSPASQGVACHWMSGTPTSAKAMLVIEQTVPCGRHSCTEAALHSLEYQCGTLQHKIEVCHSLCVSHLCRSHYTLESGWSLKISCRVSRHYIPVRLGCRITMSGPRSLRSSHTCSLLQSSPNAGCIMRRSRLPRGPVGMSRAARLAGAGALGMS